MIENNSTPVRYKQAKRKPLRILITMAFSLLAFVLLESTMFLLPSEEPMQDADYILLVITLGLAVLVPLISFLISRAVYKSDGFCILNDGISYDFTFVIKKNVKLPYDKINNVKVKRSIFERMLGLSTVAINSGSGIVAGQSEIALTFNKDYADYFADYIQKRSAAAKKNEVFVTEFVPPSEAKDTVPDISSNTDGDTVTIADKFRSVFSNGLFYLCTVFFVALLFCLFYFDPETTFEIGTGLPEMVMALIASLFISIIIMALIFIGTIIYTFIRYYDYKIYEKDGCLHISFGLINKHSVIVSKDKIRGYSFGQGLLRQMLGIASLRLIVVGINDMSSNNQPTITYLYPCGKLKKLQAIVDKYLPEFKYEGGTEKANKFAFLHNFVIPAVWITLLLSPLLVIASIFLNPYFMLALPVILLLQLINSLLLKKNCSLGLNKELLYSSSGGFYKQTNVIRTASVQEIRSYAGFIRRKQNLSTYRVVYRGDMGIFGNRFYVRNLPKVNNDEFK